MCVHVINNAIQMVTERNLILTKRHNEHNRIEQFFYYLKSFTNAIAV